MQKLRFCFGAYDLVQTSSGAAKGLRGNISVESDHQKKKK